MNQPNWIISPGFGVNISKKSFELPPPILTYIKTPRHLYPKTHHGSVKKISPAFERVFQAILSAAFQGDFETFHLGVTKVNSPENDTGQPTWVDQPRTDVSG